ncbi:MAG: hypothetical protein JWN18_274 [Parcubacteria group bacterium]|nr:hypothetical protein [Parcubacteria group bacterium]
MKNNALTSTYIIDNSIFRIGVVFSVEGQSIKVKVDKGKNSSSVLYKGSIIQNISVGGYIKIKKGFSEMIGKIEGESISEDKEFSRVSYKSNKEKINRVLNVKILGFIEEGTFCRGIKELPLIDNKCFLLSKEEFEEIHNFIQKGDERIEVGALEYDDGQKIDLGINSLFASHIGIFGNTGSGKSYTLAKLYRELFKKFKDSSNFKSKAKFFLIDFNGEYADDDVIIEKKYKNIYKLSTSSPNPSDKFPVKKETLRDVGFWSIFLEATEKTQIPFINRAIKDSYIESKLNTELNFKTLIKDKIEAATTVNGKNIDRALTIDLLYELASFLDNESLRQAGHYFKQNLSGGNENISFYLKTNLVPPNDKLFSDRPAFKEKISEQIDLVTFEDFSGLSVIKKVGLRIIIKYYDEMIRGFSNREHLSPLIKRMEKRILDLEKVITVHGRERFAKNLTIISLKDVNLDIRKMLPLLICKELYDTKKEANNKDTSLHIIIDEAHNILSGNSERESEQWKDYRLETFEEIIKEGRKFATFLTISSQRPSDISPTIISQLHNYFLHRLINNNDLLAVEKTIAYLDKVSADSIPNLATGTCILAGLLAQIPVVMKVNKISNKKNQPVSQTINLLEKWKPV